MKKLLLISTILLAETLMVNAQSENPSLADKSNPEVNSCIIGGVVLQQQNVKCYGGTTGTAVIFASSFGSTGPYTFTWSPTVTNYALDSIDGALNLAAGTYTVSITNNHGCLAGTVHVTITQPPKLTLTTSSSTNEICNGGNNGSATVIAGGGVPSYSYSWTPTVSTTTSASNLTAGNYFITVTDSNKCTTTNTVIITQPVAITTSATVGSSSCNSSNGSVGVTASNGVTPYSYLWTPGGNTTDSISGVSVGSYTCTVTDAHGCKVNTTEIVTDSTTLSASLVNSVNEKCFGDNNGSA